MKIALTNNPAGLSLVPPLRTPALDNRTSQPMFVLRRTRELLLPKYMEIQNKKCVKVQFNPSFSLHFISCCIYSIMFTGFYIAISLLYIFAVFSVSGCSRSRSIGEGWVWEGTYFSHCSQRDVRDLLCPKKEKQEDQQWEVQVEW